MKDYRVKWSYLCMLMVAVLATAGCKSSGSGSSATEPAVGACTISLPEDINPNDYQRAQGGAIYSAGYPDTAVYVLDGATGNNRVLDQRLDSWVIVSNTGRYTKYAVDNGGVPQRKLYDFSSDRFVDFGGRDWPQYWSPKDSYFLYANGDSWEIVDTKLGVVTPLETAPGAGSVRWAEGESRFAFASSHSIVVYNADGSELFRLTLPSGQSSERIEDTHTALSPDGRFLAYIKRVGNDYQYRLVDIVLQSDTQFGSAAGTWYAVTTMTTTAALAWSPSSRYLAYARDSGEGYPLSVYDTQAGTRTDLFSETSPWWVTGFKWAPGRDIVAYSGYNSGTVEEMLYGRSFETASDSFELSPYIKPWADVNDFLWSPNSRFIATSTEPESEGSRETLFVVDFDRRCYSKLNRELDTGSGEEVAHQYSWSPSGLYVLYKIYRDFYDYDYIAAKIDRSAQIDLTGAMYDASSEAIGSYRWLPSSDAIYFEHYAEQGSGTIDSLNILEVDALQKSSVYRSGAGNFGSSRGLVVY